MLREISEIESIGDSCYNIARTIHRKMESKAEFTEKLYSNIEQMFELTNAALTQMNQLMKRPKESFNPNHTVYIEHEINNFRNQLKTQNIEDLDNNLYSYSVSTMYMDIIQECEKLGDYVVNVVEARIGVEKL